MKTISYSECYIRYLFCKLGKFSENYFLFWVIHFVLFLFVKDKTGREGAGHFRSYCHVLIYVKSSKCLVEPSPFRWGFSCHRMTQGPTQSQSGYQKLFGEISCPPWCGYHQHHLSFNAARSKNTGTGSVWHRGMHNGFLISFFFFLTQACSCMDG